MTSAEDLAKRFEQVNQDLIKSVEACSDAQWRAQCAAEKWGVGVAAHHVAMGQEQIAGMAMAIGAGQPLPPLTMEMLDGMNADHAKKFANCTKAETISLLRSGGAKAAGIVRAISDEQLARTADVIGNQMSAQQFIEGVLIGHPQGHLGSIRATIK